MQLMPAFMLPPLLVLLLLLVTVAVTTKEPVLEEIAKLGRDRRGQNECSDQYAHRSCTTFLPSSLLLLLLLLSQVLKTRQVGSIKWRCLDNILLPLLRTRTSASPSHQK